MAYFGLLAFLYLLLSLVLPPNHKTQALYHLSSLQYHVLIFVVILPVIAIWFLAFYGYSKIKEYASLIHKTSEGPAFTKLADGMMWLAWGLPIPAFITLLVNTIANNHPGFLASSIIITNYVNILVPIIAFSILGSGSRELIQRGKLFISSGRTKMLILGFVFLGAIYCFFIFRNVGNLAADSAKNPYYLPGWLILFTIVIPYLYAWFIGLLAAYEMRLLSKHSVGLLYRQALNLLSLGLTVTVAASIGLQYLRSVLPRNGNVSLGYLLLLIYVLLGVIGAGYGLLAYGANKLKRIEEV